jgi:pilus assembly protein CpaC
VRIMEFKKTALERIGIEWTSPSTGPTVGLRVGRFQALAGPRSFANLGTDFVSKINLMVTDGDAVELAAPHLSTRSGGEATFLAGGQIPIPTTNTTGQSNVTFKDYGIKLNFKPVTDGDNNVLIKVETEVSTVDNSTVVQGIPGFLTRRTSAEANVRNGEPMALSGLVDTNLSNNVNKIPLLGDIPVLGQLFRSSEFRNNRTEMIVFVEPRVVEASSKDARQAEETAARIEKKRDQLLKDNLVE